MCVCVCVCGRVCVYKQTDLPILWRLKRAELQEVALRRHSRKKIDKDEGDEGTLPSEKPHFGVVRDHRCGEPGVNQG